MSQSTNIQLLNEELARTREFLELVLPQNVAATAEATMTSMRTLTEMTN